MTVIVFDLYKRLYGVTDIPSIAARKNRIR